MRRGCGSANDIFNILVKRTTTDHGVQEMTRTTYGIEAAAQRLTRWYARNHITRPANCLFLNKRQPERRVVLLGKITSYALFYALLLKCCVF